MHTPDPNREFHLFENGKTSGPYTLAMLRERHRRGQISSGAMWSQPGAAKWESLNGLATLLAGANLPRPPANERASTHGGWPAMPDGMPSFVKRNLLTLVAVGVLVVMGLWFSVIKPTSDRQNIQRVLATDKDIHGQIQQKMGLGDHLWDKSESVGKYVSAMRQIDLSGCPDDFRDAFQRHISAWSEFEGVTREYGGWSGFFKGFISGFTQGAIPNNERADLAQAQRSIKETWEQVMRVAQNHGVR